ncbi:beta-ketoacyl-ACP synthase III [Kaarinaea lacus]
MTNEVFINAIEAVLPNDPVYNDEMENVLGLINNKPSRARPIVLKRNGIKSRHYVIDKHTGALTHNNTTLTAVAIRKLNGPSFDLSTTEFLSCGSSSPDQLIPNHSVMVHGELGIPPCEVVATAGICTSGMTALKYAYLSVLAGNSKNAIAAGSEVVSTLMMAKNFSEEAEARLRELEKRPEIAFEKDFLRWMLSDGAGAVLLETRPNEKGRSLKVEWIDLISYANQAEACMYCGAEKQSSGQLKGWREFASVREVMEQSMFSVQQDVKLLDKTIVPLTVELGLAKLRDKHQLIPENIDYFLPHFSSEYFRPKLRHALEGINFYIPQEKWFTNLTTKGNTGAASIYIMLEELFHSGRLEKGQKILCFVPESGRFSTAFMLLSVV